MTGCRLAVDIGGTFTDVVLETPDGFVSDKVLTTPEAPEKGVIAGVAKILARARVMPSDVAVAIHGATLATNAIIERRGARTALISTEGFRDTLEFAFGHRFDQYDLLMRRPEPLAPRPMRFEARERIAADGSVLLPLDEPALRELARALGRDKVESVALSFIHAYRNPAHESRAREILLEENPRLYVSVSHEVCPEIREYERASTTVANAYVQPLIASYLSRLTEGLREMGLTAPLLMIMSSGSLTSVETAKRFPIRLVESGPAGGAILGQHVAREIGAEKAIAFDMGGTTAKIILLNGFEPRHARAMEVGRVHRFLAGSGLPLRIPVIDMIEIGAGGGSIASVDAIGRIVVGPRSAGASPGPACYGLGGESPTITDADLLLGKLDPLEFAGGSMRLDEARARAAIDAHVAESIGVDATTAAAGIVEIVDENMANATRVHASDHGDEIETRTLIATGGAAPLHAGRIARKLGINRIVIPTGAGVGSAHGFLRAPVAYEAVASRVVSLKTFDADAINGVFSRLRADAKNIVELGTGYGATVERRYADMRYRGQGHDLSVELPARDYSPEDGEVLGALFERMYRRVYSRSIPGLGVEALTWTLVLSRAPPVAAMVERKREIAVAPAAAERVRKVFDADVGRFVEARVYQRDALAEGTTFAGPALIVENQTTTFAPSDFDGVIGPHGHIVLTRRS